MAKKAAVDRCEEAFKKWYPVNDEDLAHVDQIGQLTRDDWAFLGWKACWRYLQENAYKEFIER